MIEFESLYEDIKNNPNYVWELLYENILKIVKIEAYRKNTDWNDVLQESYLIFLELCDKYDPYYNDNFYPFRNYLFSKLIRRLKANLNFLNFKKSREEVRESFHFDLIQLDNDVENIVINNMELNFYLKFLNQKQITILKLYNDGYKQHEISKVVNLSQSRISVILQNIPKLIKRKIKKKK